MMERARKKRRVHQTGPREVGDRSCSARPPTSVGSVCLVLPHPVLFGQSEARLDRRAFIGTLAASRLALPPAAQALLQRAEEVID